MPLSSTPQTAQNIIAFDGTAGRAARLNYSVPLPGRFVGRRAVVLNLGLGESDWSGSAKSAGVNLPKALGLEEVSEGVYTFDEAKATAYWLDYALASGVPGDQLDLVERYASGTAAIGGLDFGEGEAPFSEGVETSTPTREGEVPYEGVRRSVRSPLMGRPTPGSIGLTPYPDGGGTGPTLPPALAEYGKFLAALGQGKLVMPQGKWGGGVGSTPVKPVPNVQPTLMLIEVYGISSFLGDYGLGRTVKTFTLLPGESTMISLKTWKSTEAKQADASSIIDSFQTTAADKFRATVQRETSDKATIESTSGVRVESAGIDLFGVIKVNASGGVGTETHASRDSFSKQVNECVREHANEASAKRETTVTSSSEWSEKTGEEALTERTIKNVNLRRVLNFVFRELNQEYVTKIHLKEVRVAFTNGRPFSWREVPLSGLRTLLKEVVAANKVDQVAKDILKLAAITFDYNDQPNSVLETFTISADGQTWQQAPATMTAGAFPAPTDTMFYRFKRGPLGQGNASNPVDGVLLSEDRVTLRTDSVIVEALLGQADALDEYAMEIQRAEAEAKSLANDREEIAQQALQAISDPEERTESFAEMFNKPFGDGEVVIHTEPHA